jgi:hypothetical protein
MIFLLGVIGIGLVEIDSAAGRALDHEAYNG